MGIKTAADMITKWASKSPGLQKRIDEDGFERVKAVYDAVTSLLEPNGRMSEKKLVAALTNTKRQMKVSQYLVGVQGSFF